VATRKYQDLIVWQRAMDLTMEVYAATDDFPRDELFGLTSQLRRAVVSVPSNIAEGQGRGPGAAFAHHLRIAQGSLQEAETQLIVGQRRRYVDQSRVDRILDLAAEVGRLNRRLQQSL
jgi:four helix bundle protein